jgi:hypothetical protein
MDFYSVAPSSGCSRKYVYKYEKNKILEYAPSGCHKILYLVLRPSIFFYNIRLITVCLRCYWTLWFK